MVKEEEIPLFFIFILVMAKLYTFGCSYTKYLWPTWANIIATHYDYNHHFNCAQPGAGNYYIAEKLYEMHLKFGITKEDSVIIMMTSANRFDVYDPKEQAFKLNGNVYNSEHIFGEKFVNEVWNDEHSIYNTWFMVKAMDSLLKGIGCKYKIVQAFDLGYLDTGHPLNSDENTDRLIKDYYKTVYNKETLQSYSKQYNPTSYFFEDIQKLDGHPTIMCNHDFVKEHLSEFYHPQMLEIATMWENEMPKNNYQLETRNNFEIQDFKFSKLKIPHPPKQLF